MAEHEAGAAGHRGGGVKARLREELRNYLIVSAYLYVCFGAIQLFKTAVLRDVGVEYLPLGFAAAKALILGKFLLLGDAAHIGSRAAAPTLARRIVQRVALLFAALVALVAVEELAVGWIHGRSVAETIGEYGHRLPEVLAMLLLLLLILVPLVAVTEVSRAMGPGALRDLFLSSPAPASDAADAAAKPTDRRAS